MSETTTTPETTDEQTPAWYRDQMAAKDAEVAEMQKQLNRQKVQLLDKAFAEAGLDPTKGIGKAVAEKFDGEPDKAAIQQFAIDEYGWEPPGVNPTEVVNQAQQRVSGVVAEAGSAELSEIDTQIEEAYAAGDFARSTYLKVQKFRQEQGI